MALNPKKKIIAAGAWVRVEYLDQGKWTRLGLVTQSSYEEDFSVQPGKVIGHLGPISLDAQDYSCRITIGALVPEIKDDPNRTGAAEGNAIADLLPTRSEVQTLGKGRTFEGLRFVNSGPGAEAEINLAVFSYVVVSSNGQQINANAYVTSNIQLLAVERLNPTEAAALLQTA